MRSAQQQVVDLIHDYQAAVYKAVALLNAKSEQERGFQRHEESPGAWAGYLDDLRQVRYHFHGTGCLVTAPEFEVNFDYAREGGCTGVDTWFMYDFLESNPAIEAKYPLLTSGEQVKQLLEELAHEGLLTKDAYSVGDRRYYLTTDIGNPNLPEVTLHSPDGDDFDWDAAA